MLINNTNAVKNWESNTVYWTCIACTCTVDKISKEIYFVHISLTFSRWVTEIYSNNMYCRYILYKYAYICVCVVAPTYQSGIASSSSISTGCIIGKILYKVVMNISMSNLWCVPCEIHQQDITDALLNFKSIIEISWYSRCKA